MDFGARQWVLCLSLAVGLACSSDPPPEPECEGHMDCPEGERCFEGNCETGGPCATTPDCLVADDPCLTARCEPATRTCIYGVLDGDGDGSSPSICGGFDCDDGDPDIHPGAVDVCDGVDADCSGDEPPDSPGCAVNKECSDGRCVCVTGRSDCGGFCYDLSSDRTHCGRCNNGCIGGQVCRGGSCVCPGPEEFCERACVDTTTSTSHCGGCDISCNGLMCLDGSCGCGPALSGCPRGSVLACVDLDSDIQHCGACGNECASGATCLEGVCSIRADGLFSAYGISTSVSAFDLSGTNSGSRIDFDAVSNSIATVEETTGAIHQHLDGPSSFDGSEANFVLYGPDGVHRWVAATTMTARRQVTAEGAHVFVAMSEDGPSGTLSGQTFLREIGSERIELLAELDHDTGEVVQSVDFGALDVRITDIDANSAGEVLVLLEHLEGTVDLGGGPFDAADGQGIVVIYGPGLVHRHSFQVPFVSLGQFNPGGDIVLHGALLAEASFRGGPVLAPAFSGYLARLTPEGGHLSSFIRTGRVLAVTARGVWVQASVGFGFYRFDGTELRLPAPWSDPDVQAEHVAISGSDLFVSGQFLSRTDVGEIRFGRSAFVARFDADTLVLRDVTTTPAPTFGFFALGGATPTVRTVGTSFGIERFAGRRLGGFGSAHSFFVDYQFR